MSALSKKDVENVTDLFNDLVKGIDQKVKTKKKVIYREPTGYYFVYDGKIAESVHDKPGCKLITVIPVMEPIGSDLLPTHSEGPVGVEGYANWFRYKGAIQYQRDAYIIADMPFSVPGRKVMPGVVLGINNSWMTTEKYDK